jgi:hypothetical protein
VRLRGKGHFSRRQWAAYAAVLAVALIAAVIIGATLQVKLSVGGK